MDCTEAYSPMASLLQPCYLCQRKRGKSFTFIFSGITYSRKSGNPKLIPYETIVRATSGEPEAVEEVLRHYSRRIRLAALENGHVNTDTEDSIKQRLITALFQFRFD